MPGATRPAPSRAPAAAPPPAGGSAGRPSRARGPSTRSTEPAAPTWRELVEDLVEPARAEVGDRGGRDLRGQRGLEPRRLTRRGDQQARPRSRAARSARHARSPLPRAGPVARAGHPTRATQAALLAQQPADAGLRRVRVARSGPRPRGRAPPRGTASRSPSDPPPRVSIAARTCSGRPIARKLPTNAVARSP